MVEDVGCEHEQFAVVRLVDVAGVGATFAGCARIAVLVEKSLFETFDGFIESCFGLLINMLVSLFFVIDFGDACDCCDVPVFENPEVI